MSRTARHQRCPCQSCRELDRQFPKEGFQLRLPLAASKAAPPSTRLQVSKNDMPEMNSSPGRLLKISEVEQETSLHRATIYRRIAAGNFPAPVKLSERRVAWPLAAV